MTGHWNPLHPEFAALRAGVAPFGAPKGIRRSCVPGLTPPGYMISPRFGGSRHAAFPSTETG